MTVLGDLQLSPDGRHVLLTRGADMALQQIRVGAQIWAGTIDWDPDAGLPMLGTILVKGPDYRVVAQIFRGFLLATAGVVSVDELTVKLERTTRRLTVRFRVTCEDGASASDEVAFAFA
ncbi:MAG TPA: hypothetical protein VNN80_30935 [Polyangiaceae bacterium]|nr:hypothetical protein [Polyangiaceae bacterium]